MVPSLEVLWLSLLCSLSLVQPNSLRSRRTNYIGWTHSEIYSKYTNTYLHVSSSPHQNTLKNIHIFACLHPKLSLNAAPDHISFHSTSSTPWFPSNYPETGIIEIQCNMATSRIKRCHDRCRKTMWRCG